MRQGGNICQHSAACTVCKFLQKRLKFWLTFCVLRSTMLKYYITMGGSHGYRLQYTYEYLVFESVFLGRCPAFSVRYAGRSGHRHRA